jgi:hypothetical protein
MSEGMAQPPRWWRQSQQLQQIGGGLLLFASFEGFVVPYFALWSLRMSNAPDGRSDEARSSDNPPY